MLPSDDQIHPGELLDLVHPVEFQRNEVVERLQGVDRIAKETTRKQAEIVVDLASRRDPEPPTWMKHYNVETDFLEEIAQTVFGEAIEISGFLVQVPKQRRGIDGAATRLQDTVCLSQRLLGLLEMFQDRSAKHGVE
jgi:hypothetical protein